MGKKKEKSAVHSEIGARIRQIRQRIGITASRLAELAEISPGYLSEVERGLAEISSQKLARIANELGVSTDELLNGESPQLAKWNHVSVPTALSTAAEDLGLSHRTTLRLLEGKQSLRARRSQKKDIEWTVEQWKDFYNKVRDILEDD